MAISITNNTFKYHHIYTYTVDLKINIIQHYYPTTKHPFLQYYELYLTLPPVRV